MITFKGTATTEGYSAIRAPSPRRQGRMYGRPSYRLRNLQPVYVFTVTYVMDADELAEFQHLWQSGPVYGDPFWMTLKVTTNDLIDIVPCVAIGPLTINRGVTTWTVTFDVEIPSDTLLTGTICDVILASTWTQDEIVADISAPDVIEPCPGVL